jgi:site-specific DNA recombinase
MPSTNGHGPKRAILYARVSTDEQARSGYSIPDQLGTLRAYAAEQGYEVKEECVDDGWSGADPDRPGLRRVMDLAQAGRAEVVVAIKRDRFFRSRLYRLLMDKDLEEHGVRLEALNDTGNRIGDGVQDDFAEWEREQITERTTAGRREKARQGKVIAGRLPNYGFRFGPDRESYEVVEEEIVVVRRIFSELASRASVNSICTTLDADGVPPSGKGKKNWQRTFVRDCAFDDVYAPHTVEELKALGLSPKVCGELDPARLYGVWWYNRRETRTVRVPLRGGRYRKEKQIRKKPTAEWIPVPVPASGVPREAVVRARERLEGQAKCSNAQMRFWELSGGVLRCSDCGRGLIAVSAWKGYTRKDGTRKRHFHYACATRRQRGKEACSYSRTPNARKIEAEVWEAVKTVLLDPERLERGLDAYLEAEKEKDGGDPEKEARVFTNRIAEVDRKRAAYQDLVAGGLMEREELRAKLDALSHQKAAAEEGLNSLEERRHKVRELQMSREKILANYRVAVPEALEEAEGKQRRTVYNTLGVTVWAAKAKEDPIKIEFSVLGGEEVCRHDRTSTR